MGAIISAVIIGLTLKFASTKYVAFRDKTDTNFSTYTKVGAQAPDFSYGQEDGF